MQSSCACFIYHQWIESFDSNWIYNNLLSFVVELNAEDFLRLKAGPPSLQEFRPFLRIPFPHVQERPFLDL